MQLLRDLGAAISPFNAFLIAQGIETLSLRDRAARRERRRRSPRGSRPATTSVGRTTPGLESSPWHAAQLKYAPTRRRRGARVRARGRDRGRSGVRVGARAALERRQHRRRALARHPPGVDDAQPADARGAAARPASRPAWSASRWASSTSTTSWLTWTRASAPPRVPDRMSTTPPTPSSSVDGTGGPAACPTDRPRPPARWRARPGRAGRRCRRARVARRRPGGRRQFADLGPFELESGGRLPAVRLAYETWGELNEDGTTRSSSCTR